MQNVRNIWSAATGPIKQLGTKRIQQQQRRTATGTELRYLKPGPYEQLQDPYDTSYQPHGITYENVTFDEDPKFRSNQPENLATKYTEGWRFGAINCAISASVVFLINFVVTIWGSSHKEKNNGVLHEGDCTKVRQMNTGLHFLINLLSTILLSSSNYCMQCLSAPTRKEIDSAHTRGIWLDVGVPSVRNLRYISKVRVLLWVLLGFSSLPLHLFYNSAVFASIQTNDYHAFTVSEDFVNNAQCRNCQNITSGTGSNNNQPGDYTPQHIQDLHAAVRSNTFDRLENKDCINAYAQMIQSFRRNVILVTSNADAKAKNQTAFKGTDIYGFNTFEADRATTPSEAPDTYAWICAQLKLNSYTNCAAHIDEIKNNAANWSPGGYKVEYCLSEKAPGHCKLQFSVQIAILVTILNFAKAAIIFYTAFLVKDNPIMTVGDAVSSFLDTPDPLTKDMCLLSMQQAKRGYFPALPEVWGGKVYRWKDVTSTRRRTTALVLFLCAIIMVSTFLGIGIAAMPDGSRSLSALASLGYGAVDPRTVITGWTVYTVVANVLIANLAQPILSFLYFSYNGLFTCMLLGYEWSQFAHRRKGLRVSRTPRGAQRATYFLQLPYRFALPLMGLSGVLHWLVSQSIFLVAIEMYTYNGIPNASASTPDEENRDGSWITCGYSPIAIISVLILAILMVVAMSAFGYVKYKPGINVAGSCSAAISAACHHVDEGLDGDIMSWQKLKWGVIRVPEGEAAVGHCGMSTREVGFPVKGMKYAGFAEHTRTSGREANRPEDVHLRPGMKSRE